MEETRYILAIYSTAFKRGKSKYSLLKENIGLEIAEKLLKKMGYKDMVPHPFDPLLRKGPDLLVVDKNGKKILFEVKVSSLKDMETRYRDAIHEIRKHVFKIYRRDIKRENIEEYGVIIIGIGDFFNIPLRSRIYFNKWRIKNERRKYR